MKSTSMILVSEIGDKTFFVAAVSDHHRHALRARFTLCPHSRKKIRKMARFASPVSTKFVFFSSSLATLPLLSKRNSCIISRTLVVCVPVLIGLRHLSSQLMAMRHPRRLVLIGALGALWVNLKSPLPIRTPPLGISRLVNRVFPIKNPLLV